MLVLLDDLLMQHSATVGLVETLASESIRLVAEVDDATLAYQGLHLLENGQLVAVYGERERRLMYGLDQALRRIWTSLKDLDLLGQTLDAQALREARETRDGDCKEGD